MKADSTISAPSSLLTERNGLAGFTVHPMCPHAVIAVGFLSLRKADYLQHTFSALFTGDKPTFYTDNDSHHSEARTTDGSCLEHRPLLRSCARSGFGMGKIPKVTESLLLDKGHRVHHRRVAFLSHQMVDLWHLPSTNKPQKTRKKEIYFS